MGGEKYLPCFNADGFVGSPPRWRGKVFFDVCQPCRLGITPAWAGKRSRFRRTAPASGDHPRVGGEK